MQKFKKMRYIIMKVLTKDLIQGFSIIPTREVVGVVSLEFTNETTKEVYLRTATSLIQTDLLEFNVANLNFLIQDNFYNLKVTNDNEVIYKDRIFCTNYSSATYSINNGEYTLPNIDNNDYITI